MAIILCAIQYILVYLFYTQQFACQSYTPHLSPSLPSPLWQPRATSSKMAGNLCFVH